MTTRRIFRTDSPSNLNGREVRADGTLGDVLALGNAATPDAAMTRAATAVRGMVADREQQQRHDEAARQRRADARAKFEAEQRGLCVVPADVVVDPDARRDGESARDAFVRRQNTMWQPEAGE